MVVDNLLTFSNRLLYYVHTPRKRPLWGSVPIGGFFFLSELKMGTLIVIFRKNSNPQLQKPNPTATRQGKLIYFAVFE